VKNSPYSFHACSQCRNHYEAELVSKGAVITEWDGLARQLMLQSSSAWAETSLPHRVNTKAMGLGSLKLERRSYCRSWETVRCPNCCLNKELEGRTVNSYLNYGDGAVRYLIILFFQ